MSTAELLERLFLERGIAEGEREQFLNPDFSLLHDPELLPDMEKARDRIIAAMKDGEHIVIFSDYDADGIPGAVVLHDFFTRAGYENVSFYIPHRHDEGFGLNRDALNECAERGAKLVITIDCGTCDHEEIAHARSLGMDVIITDHHEENGTLPEAYAVVNPKRLDSQYPFKDLCGSGVAYKLVQAILKKENFGIKEGMEKWSLDMVGLATLSDMVPLLGENRILARFGLEVLRKSPRPGLAALFKKLRINQRFLTEDDLAFMITPRINAASRMGSPEDAFKLLSTGNQAEAEVLAEHLEKINKERKTLVGTLVKDAKKHLAERELKDVIVIGNPEWRPSLAGLVANSLVEEYSRPVFVWGRDGDNILKGSCRTYNGYDLHALMTSVSDLFIEFGGHKQAGGFSVSLENLSVLEEKLSEALKDLSQTIDKENEEMEISIGDVGEDLWNTISLFAPFGVGNPKPVFKISSDIKSIRQFGKEQNHMEIELGNGMKAISFFSNPTTYSLLPTASSCTLLGHLEKSYFMDRPELRMRIVDIIA